MPGRNSRDEGDRDSRGFERGPASDERFVHGHLLVVHAPAASLDPVAFAAADAAPVAVCLRARRRGIRRGGKGAPLGARGKVRGSEKEPWS
jgi:hypothetical protein